MSIAVFCGLVIFVLLAVMLLAGVPIAIALAVSSICAILPVLNLGASVLTGAQRIFSGISVFSLLAIPFFILAGNIMNKGGIAIRLINFAKLFTGSIPGALAHTNAVANMLFGAISGSGTAAASAMGSIIGPIEEEEGYDRDFSAAANIATAPTGLLIPPQQCNDYLFPGQRRHLRGSPFHGRLYSGHTLGTCVYGGHLLLCQEERIPQHQTLYRL